MLTVSMLDIDMRGHSVWSPVKNRKIQIACSRYYAQVNHEFVCDNCGEAIGFDIQHLEDGFYVADKPCLGHSITTYTYTLEIPSGKIVFRDGFYHDILPTLVEPKNANYNTILGCEKAVIEYANQGIAYGPVLGPAPEVFYDHLNQRIVLGLGGEDDNGKRILGDGWEYLGSIVTDLWAYSVMDYESFVQNGGDISRVEVAEVPAGTYHVEHNVLASLEGPSEDWDEGSTFEYASMTLVE